MMDDKNLSQHPIEWAMETDIDPVFTLANWLVQDALDTKEFAVDVIASPNTSLDDFRTLKRIFKQLRTQGELPADRRLGARLYAASIAGALVTHDRVITAQSTKRLREAFDDLTGDRDMPDSIIDMARKSIRSLPS